MLHELFESFLLVFLAEMGDKSQLLAMTFAARYPIRKVLLGVLIGALLNDGLAVLLGSLVSTLLPIKTIQIVAGFTFIAFALWTLKPDGEEDESSEHKMKLGPVLTVAIAYFIGEFGDKTQLTAITLASQAVFPVMILAGTVSGMILTGGIGIWIGRKLGDKLPETAIRMVSSSVFLFFGITRLVESLPQQYLSFPNILIFSSVLVTVVLFLLRSIIRSRQLGQESALIRRSRELHEYYNRIKQDFDSICLGTRQCGMCQGSKCLVGSTKSLIQNELDDKLSRHYGQIKINVNSMYKPFNRQQAMESLLATLNILKTYPPGKDLEPIHQIRRNLEVILFGRSIQELHDWKQYERDLFEINQTTAASLICDLKKSDKKRGI